MIVERVGLAKTERLLLPVKDFVHDEIDAGEAIARERECNHCPRSSTPLERGVGDVLVIGKRRQISFADGDEVSSRHRVVGDDDASVAVDQRDRTAETTFPQCSRVHLARGPGVA